MSKEKFTKVYPNGKVAHVGGGGRLTAAIAQVLSKGMGGEHDTEVLTSSSVGRTRYNFKEMIKYCEVSGKRVEDLTTQEKQQFIIQKGESNE